MLPMALPNYRVRRATVDDLGALTALWESMNFPLQTLEKRLTEFQIAEGPQGHIAGAFGFQINGRYGLIHSEAFSDFSTADEIRSLFWQRIQPLAMNHATDFSRPLLTCARNFLKRGSMPVRTGSRFNSRTRK
jgi:hypothetical protein